MNFEVKTYKHANGNMTKYAVMGHGEKIFVMIPGLSIKPVTESAHLVAEAYGMFEEEFTIYLFDRTLPVAENMTVNDIAENLYEVINALGFRETYCFGASQGGMILQSLMINHGDIIKKSVLASTAGKTDSVMQSKIGEWMRFAKEKNTKDLHIKFFKDVYSEELIKSLGDGIYSLIPECTDEELDNFYALANACSGFNSYEKADTVKIPTLVLGSAKDKIMSVESQTELAKKFNAELYIYNGFGHAVYDEAPDFKQKIYDFFVR